MKDFEFTTKSQRYSKMVDRANDLVNIFENRSPTFIAINFDELVRDSERHLKRLKRGADDMTITPNLRFTIKEVRGRLFEAMEEGCNKVDDLMDTMNIPLRRRMSVRDYAFMALGGVVTTVSAAAIAIGGTLATNGFWVIGGLLILVVEGRKFINRKKGNSDLR